MDTDGDGRTRTEGRMHGYVPAAPADRSGEPYLSQSFDHNSAIR